MFNCNFCNSVITEAFVGSKDEIKVYSCFNCFIQTLNPFNFKFDDEFVYYPLFGMRDIQLDDSIAFYDKRGQELARVHLKAYQEGLLSYLKGEIAAEINLATEDITLVIKPYKVQLKK
ncbi:hypothetical protein J2S13_003337 [Oikeobacillus pervagus]|uniref:Uncharacterized protein n=1 Tax=Oikeobacillus pervagus TaxID=1325931 RepID=A0AAJ1T1U9_9BACI|nr:hypothetical protein [Oikeobacillus pervagus]MDQ0216839.1 hypothetical protein [Oikeobacillus pervagus]